MPVGFQRRQVQPSREGTDRKREFADSSSHGLGGHPLPKQIVYYQLGGRCIRGQLIGEADLLSSWVRMTFAEYRHYIGQRWGGWPDCWGVARNEILRAGAGWLVGL